MRSRNRGRQIFFYFSFEKPTYGRNTDLSLSFFLLVIPQNALNVKWIWSPCARIYPAITGPLWAQCFATDHLLAGHWTSIGSQVTKSRACGSYLTLSNQVKRAGQTGLEWLCHSFRSFWCPHPYNYPWPLLKIDKSPWRGFGKTHTFFFWITLCKKNLSLSQLISWNTEKIQYKCTKKHLVSEKSDHFP